MGAQEKIDRKNRERRRGKNKDTRDRERVHLLTHLDPCFKNPLNALLHTIHTWDLFIELVLNECTTCTATKINK